MVDWFLRTDHGSVHNYGYPYPRMGTMAIPKGSWERDRSREYRQLKPICL